MVEIECFGQAVTSNSLQDFHSECSPEVAHLTSTWSCRVTISDLRILWNDITVRESIPCTKVGSSIINLVMAWEHIHSFLNIYIYSSVCYVWESLHVT